MFEALSMVLGTAGLSLPEFLISDSGHQLRIIS